MRFTAPSSGLSWNAIENTIKKWKAVINDLDLRQVDVAARLGFTSTDRISHWENGTHLPSVTNLFKLSALYKAPAPELYGEFFKVVENAINHCPDPTFS